VLTRAAIKARGTGRGDEDVRATFQLGVNVQHVTTHHTTRRMHQHVMANGITLRVQGLQDAQRPVVAVVGDGALARVVWVAARMAVAQIKLAVPCHGRCRRAARELKKGEC
jgi:hypothetical protein